jgi:hypothetical protein
MANIKISELTEAAFPLDGTEDLVLVQGGVTKRCDLSNLVAPGTPITVKVSLTSAEILALNTTPKTLVPAPGAGKMIQPIYFMFKLNYNSVAYATNLNLKAYIDDPATRTDADVNFWLNNTANSVNIVPIDAASGVYSGSIVAQITNAALKLKVETGNPTAGNSTMDVYVTYFVVTL